MGVGILDASRRLRTPRKGFPSVGLVRALTKNKRLFRGKSDLARPQADYFWQLARPRLAFSAAVILRMRSPVTGELSRLISQAK